MIPVVAVPEPDSAFVAWLHRFDPDLRVRWNPSRQRWVIDERNQQTRLWQCILVWEADDGAFAPLNRDLVLRLELMRAKYQQMIVSPQQYITELVHQAETQRERMERSAADDRRHMIVDDIRWWRKGFAELR